MTQSDILKDLIDSKDVFIFDMDGTIVNLEYLNYSSFKKSIESLLNTNLSIDEYRNMIAGFGSTEGVRNFVKVRGYNPDVNEILDLFKKNKRGYLENDFNSYVSLIEGFMEYINLLKSRNKLIYLCTSSGREFTDLILSKFNITTYFKNTYTANDVKNSKPNPEIFLKAVDDSRVSIDSCVVFEDSLAGIEACKRASIDYVVVYTKGVNEKSVLNENMVISDYTI